ncbi:MAG: terminase family protein [Clostridia bacterium]|nr:terminase family protein [Clostridia bacterium]
MDELLQKIKAIEQEQRLRSERDFLSRYNTGKKKHKKQLAFHRSKKRNRWVFGGNRSGKTECGAAEAVWMARGNHPYRKNRREVFGWVVSPTAQVQRDVAQKKILRYLRPDWIADIVMTSGRKDAPMSGVIDQIYVKNVFGGTSVIGFKSADQGRERFQGSSLDFVWFDEEPPKEIYEECRMRVVDREGDIFGTMTPLKGLTFVYEEIYLNPKNDPQIWYEFMEWADNPYLSKKEITLLENTMDETTLQSRRFGRFCTREGLVYPEFDESVHVIPPFDIPPEWQDTITIDPGLKNPLAALWCAVDFDGNVYVVSEHYVAGMGVDEHAEAIRRISERLGWKRDERGRISALIDSAADARTLNGMRSVTELFYERGILASPRVNKELFGGIAQVKSYLSRKNNLPDLYIFSNCTNLIREFKGYFWGSGEIPVKRDDHALDAIRYYLMTKPRSQRPDFVKTEIEKDKERRIRRLRRR